MYARMEEADALIESLMQDKDHNLRQSGMYTVAMAYCGTGNNKAIKRLLHVAVRSTGCVTRNTVTPYRHVKFTCKIGFSLSIIFTDLILREVFSLFILYNIITSWLYTLNGFRIIYTFSDSATQEREEV